MFDWIYIMAEWNNVERFVFFYSFQMNNSISSQHKTKYNPNRLEMTIAHLRNDL